MRHVLAGDGGRPTGLTRMSFLGSLMRGMWYVVWKLMRSEKAASFTRGFLI